MTTHSASASGNGTLPQYGFGADIDFVSLLKNNPYLFRIYTPKERSPFFDDTDPYFLAPKFNEQYARSPVEIRDHQQLIDSWKADYSDVVKHMDWTTRMSSPFISTSFNFAWCIWDALRRFHQGVKKDVQVAIIDGRAISDRAMTAVQLLRKSSPKDRNRDYWKWYRFSQESQSVLVYGSIPGTAVLASIPLLAILQYLPLYLLKPGYHALNRENPLVGIGWDFAAKKPSYRRFCREMSNRFLGLGLEERLADTTAGSLALALAFIRPWFYRMVDNDSDKAVNTLSSLASIIAQWPGQWWIHEHPEIHDLIHAMATTLCQELKGKHGLQVKDEVSRLEGVVDELHGMVREYEVKISTLSKRGPKPMERPALTPFTNPSTPVKSPLMEFPSPSPARIMPESSSKMCTPLTPPDSPRVVVFSRPPGHPFKSPARLTSANRRVTDPFLAEGSEACLPSDPASTPLKVAIVTTLNAITTRSFPQSQHPNIGDDISPSLGVTVEIPNVQPKSRSIALSPPLIQPQCSHTSSALSEVYPENLPLPPSPQDNSTVSEISPEYMPLPPSPVEDDDSWTMIIPLDEYNDSDTDDDTQVDEDTAYRKSFYETYETMPDSNDSPCGSPTLVIAPLPPTPEDLQYLAPKPRSGIFFEPLEFDFSAFEVDEEQFFRRPPTAIETAGCIVTGFLVGAIITICLLGPQRRMLVPLT